MNGAESFDPTLGANAVGRTEPGGRGQGGTFAAPLGGSRSGRLVLASRVSGIKVRSDAGMRDLCRARFETPVPDVLVEEGTATIRYPRFPILDWLHYRRERSAEIAVNGRHQQPAP